MSAQLKIGDTVWFFDVNGRMICDVAELLKHYNELKALTEGGEHG